MVAPVAAKLTEASGERGPGVVEVAVDAQPRVAGLVPTDTVVGRHGPLEPSQELIGSRSRLASLKVDNVRRHSRECRRSRWRQTAGKVRAPLVLDNRLIPVGERTYP